MRSFVLVIALVAAAPVARALDAKPPGPGWEEANRNDRLVIFTHDNDKVGTRDIEAVTEVNAPPKAVFDVVTDFDHYADFMPYIKESKTLKVVSPNEVLVYSRLSPPLVDDRDYCIDVKKTAGTPQNEGVFKSEWTSQPDAAPVRDGIVRVKINTGAWILTPLDGGRRTRIVYRVSTNPGGSIPSWIANKSNTTAIPDLFDAVRKRASQVAK